MLFFFHIEVSLLVYESTITQQQSYSPSMKQTRVCPILINVHGTNCTKLC